MYCIRPVDRVSDMLYLYTLSINQSIVVVVVAVTEWKRGKRRSKGKLPSLSCFNGAKGDVKFWKGDGEGRLVVD